MFWECVSVQCFGMQKQDPETSPWPKIASGAQNPFETPLETHPFQSPVDFYFRESEMHPETRHQERLKRVLKRMLKRDT